MDIETEQNIELLRQDAIYLKSHAVMQEGVINRLVAAAHDRDAVDAARGDFHNQQLEDLRAKLAEAYRALDYFSQPLEDLRAMKIREAELGTLIAAREFVERENKEKPND